jgi:hypothetical protein
MLFEVGLVFCFLYVAEDNYDCVLLPLLDRVIYQSYLEKNKRKRNNLGII